MRKLPEFAEKWLGPSLSLATGLVALAIAYLSLVPQEEVPSTGLGDHAHHFIAYGTLAVFAGLSIRKWPRWRLAAVMFAYGILLECLQWAMPFDRHPSFTDAVANTLGVAIGLAACEVVHRLARRVAKS
ncbi:MAG: VanZ family protein [Pseudomonadota bacterium]